MSRSGSNGDPFPGMNGYDGIETHSSRRSSSSSVPEKTEPVRTRTLYSNSESSSISGPSHEVSPFFSSDPPKPLKTFKKQRKGPAKIEDPIVKYDKEQAAAAAASPVPSARKPIRHKEEDNKHDPFKFVDETFAGTKAPSASDRNRMPSTRNLRSRPVSSREDSSLRSGPGNSSDQPITLSEGEDEPEERPPSRTASAAPDDVPPAAPLRDSEHHRTSFGGKLQHSSSSTSTSSTSSTSSASAPLVAPLYLARVGEYDCDAKTLSFRFEPKSMAGFKLTSAIGSLLFSIGFNEISHVKMHVQAEPRVITFHTHSAFVFPKPDKRQTNMWHYNQDREGQKDIVLHLDVNWTIADANKLGGHISNAGHAKLDQLPRDVAMKLIFGEAGQEARRSSRSSSRSHLVPIRYSNTTTTTTASNPITLDAPSLSLSASGAASSTAAAAAAVKPRPDFDNTETLAVYPEGKGGITLLRGDLPRLEPGEFLNDSIINFYLKYLELECFTDRTRERVHIFNTFFYKKLTEKTKGTTTNMFERVKKWTRGVDLFKKDFIVIPINEHAHWYLAIICYPGMDPVTDAQPEEDDADVAHVKSDDEDELVITGDKAQKTTTASTANILEILGHAQSYQKEFPMTLEDRIKAVSFAKELGDYPLTEDEADDASFTTDKSSSVDKAHPVRNGHSRSGSSSTASVVADSKPPSVAPEDEETQTILFDEKDTLDKALAAADALSCVNLPTAPMDTSEDAQVEDREKKEEAGASESEATKTKKDSEPEEDDEPPKKRTAAEKDELTAEEKQNEVLAGLQDFVYRPASVVKPSSDVDTPTDTPTDTPAKSKNGNGRRGRGKKEAKPKPLIPKQPYLLMFDSLNTHKLPAMNALRRYVQNMWDDDKSRPERDFITRRKFLSGMARVPKQSNNCDCGVYVLHYIEKFFEKGFKNAPTKDGQDPVLGPENLAAPVELEDWFDESEITQKRQDILQLIITEQSRYEERKRVEQAARLASKNTEGGEAKQREEDDEEDVVTAADIPPTLAPIIPRPAEDAPAAAEASTDTADAAATSVKEKTVTDGDVQSKAGEALVEEEEEKEKAGEKAGEKEEDASSTATSEKEAKSALNTPKRAHTPDEGEGKGESSMAEEEMKKEEFKRARRNRTM